MAIIPVHQMIDRPDLVGNLQRGVLLGQQQADRRQALADRDQVRSLAPGAIGGDADALAQIAAIDPAAAGQFQTVADNQAQKFANWFDYTDKALQAARKSGNMAPVNAALQQGAGFISKLTGKPPPTAWAPEMDAGWEQLRAQRATIGTAGSGLPTGYRELEMKLRAAGYQPGTPEYENAVRVALGTEGRASSAAMQTVEVENSDGTTTTYTFDPRKGRYTPFSAGLGQPAGQAPPTQAPPLVAGQVPFSIDPSLPPQVQTAIQQSETQGQVYGGQAPAPAGPVAGTSMAPGARSFATETGTQQARIAAMPQVNQLEAQGAGMTTAAQEAARTAALPQQLQLEAVGEGQKVEEKAEAEKRVALRAALPDLRTAQRSLLEAYNGFKDGTFTSGAGIGLIPAALQSANNQYLLTTINDQILATAERMKGTLSDKDVDFLKSATFNLNNEPQANMNIIGEKLRRINEAIQRAQAAQQGGAAPTVGGGSGGAAAPSRIRYDAQGNRIP